MGGRIFATAGANVVNPPAYYVYLDGTTIRAKNGKTGNVDYSHASDAGTVINNAINAVVASSAAGGTIMIGEGTFNIATSITMKSRIALKGSGIDATILKAANNSNIDVIKTYQFDSLTGTNSTSPGAYDVQLKDMIIDGNYANNSSSGYGIRKWGCFWLIENIVVRYTRNDGIYSEWSFNTPTTNTAHGMEDHWEKVIVYGCLGKGITYRGPHDSHWNDMIVYGGNSDGVSVETLAGAYQADGLHITMTHIYAHPITRTALIVKALVYSDECIIEGQYGSGGIGIDVQTGGLLLANGLDCYINETAVKLGAGVGIVDGNFHNNTTGISVASEENKIRGLFWGNTNGIIVRAGAHHNSIDAHILTATTGIKIGEAGGASNHSIYNLKLVVNTTNIDWANSSNTGNLVVAQIFTNSAGETAVSGTPDLTTNSLSIHSAGVGTNYTSATPVNTTASQSLTNKTLPTVNVGGMSISGTVTVSGTINWVNAITATATTGGGTLPAGPRGFISVNVSGSARKIPFYDP